MAFSSSGFRSKREKLSPVNKRLEFDSSPLTSRKMLHSVATPSPVASPVALTTSRKMLHRSNCLEVPQVLKVPSPVASPRVASVARKHKNAGKLLQFSMELNSSSESVHSVLSVHSPRHTRSGKVYHQLYDVTPNKSAKKILGAPKKILVAHPPASAKKCLPKPDFSDDLVSSSSGSRNPVCSGMAVPSFSPINTFSTPKGSPSKKEGAAPLGSPSKKVTSTSSEEDIHPILIMTAFDEDEENSPPRRAAPPPLNYSRRPMSKISGLLHPRLNSTPTGLNSSDISMDTSPPTNGVMNMRLSPVKHCFVQNNKIANSLSCKTNLLLSRSEPPKRRRTQTLANINPFTPEARLVTVKKRSIESRYEKIVNFADILVIY